MEIAMKNGFFLCWAKRSVRQVAESENNRRLFCGHESWEASPDRCCVSLGLWGRAGDIDTNRR
jgi:hypothetical protein